MINTKVLPDPVLAAPNTSLPTKEWGKADLWMSVILMYPASWSPLEVASDMGKSLKRVAPTKSRSSLGEDLAGSVPLSGAYSLSRASSPFITFLSYLYFGTRLTYRLLLLLDIACHVALLNSAMAKHHPDLIMCMKQPGIGVQDRIHISNCSISYRTAMREVRREVSNM